MKRLFLLIFAISLLSCTAQNVKPEATVYNITITNTDNSQTISGDNNQAKTTPKTETKSVADIKPDIKGGAESTKKDSMWIYWLVITAAFIAAACFAWKKLGISARIGQWLKR